MWNPNRFLSALKKSGHTRWTLYRELQARLGQDAPSKSIVYVWARRGSRGPKRGSWRAEVYKILGVESLERETKPARQRQTPAEPATRKKTAV